MTASLLPGEGAHTIQISDKDGFVILHMQKPVSWVSLDAKTAASFAEAVARAAYKAVNGDTPTPTAASQITEGLRVRLRNRVTLMLNSMWGESPIPDAKIQAERIVDQVLQEVA